jgi:hypothetical protein
VARIFDMYTLIILIGFPVVFRHFASISLGFSIPEIRDKLTIAPDNRQDLAIALFSGRVF